MRRVDSGDVARGSVPDARAGSRAEVIGDEGGVGNCGGNSAIEAVDMSVTVGHVLVDPAGVALLLERLDLLPSGAGRGDGVGSKAVGCAAWPSVWACVGLAAATAVPGASSFCVDVLDDGRRWLKKGLLHAERSREPSAPHSR